MTTTTVVISKPSLLLMVVVLVAVLANLLQVPVVVVVNAVPLTHSISQGSKECLLERLDADEYFTSSIFITSGSSLKGTVYVQGPVSPLHDDKGLGDEAKMILTAKERYEKSNTRYGLKIVHGSLIPKDVVVSEYEINFTETIDFEKLIEDNVVRPDYDDYFEDEDDEYPRLYHEIVGDDDSITDEEHDKRELEFEKAKNKMIIKKNKDKGKDKITNGLKEDTHIVREGEPWQMTFQVKAPGYYQLCLLAGWHPISAEMEIRKSSDMGGSVPDKKTGHLITNERRAMQIAEKLYIKDAADEKDLDTLHTQLRQLTRLLSEIRRKQDIERHQLTLHKTVNSHSHSRMVMTSFIETLLYMIITGYQIYTIRNWFKGSPMLG